MKSTFGEMYDWLKGSKLGHSYKDKIALFAYIANAIIVIGFFLTFFGREKTWEISLSKPSLFNWIPVKNILVKIDNILLQLPVLIDYILFVKLDWEKEGREFASNLSCDRGFMLDIGSNIGHYTALIASRYPKVKVISVEASPSNFQLLKLNCRLNNLSNVVLYNLAISDRDNETVEFFTRDCLSTIDKQFLKNWHIPSRQIKTEKIQTLTIDSLIKKENIDQISLLKMDIGGAEILTLRGASSALKQKKIKNLIIEYHSKSNKAYIEEMLKGLGYSCTVHERPAIFEQENHANGHIIASIA